MNQSANRHLEKSIQHLLLAIRADRQNENTYTLIRALSHLAQAFYLAKDHIDFNEVLNQQTEPILYRKTQEEISHD